MSLGLRRFGLSRAHLRAVRQAWPDAGFHWRLVTLTARQFLHAPLRPLPMVHWWRIAAITSFTDAIGRWPIHRTFAPACKSATCWRL